MSGELSGCISYRNLHCTCFEMGLKLTVLEKVRDHFLIGRNVFEIPIFRILVKLNFLLHIFVKKKSSIFISSRHILESVLSRLCHLQG